MTFMYRIAPATTGVHIERVMVVGYDDRFVHLLDQRKVARHTILESYHLTWEDAHTALLKYGAARVDTCLDELGRALEFWEHVKCMGAQT